MADDNRPLKYMRYAIGEIVLVVIGILIALNINNQNELRKNEIKTTSILKEVHSELAENIKRADELILHYKAIDSGIYSIMNEQINSKDFETSKTYTDPIASYDVMTIKDQSFEKLIKNTNITSSGLDTLVVDLRDLFITMKEVVDWGNDVMGKTTDEYFAWLTLNTHWYNYNYFNNRKKLTDEEIAFYFSENSQYKNFAQKYSMYGLENHYPAILGFRYYAYQAYKDISEKLNLNIEDTDSFSISMTEEELQNYIGTYKSKESQYHIINRDNKFYYQQVYKEKVYEYELFFINKTSFILNRRNESYFFKYFNFDENKKVTGFTSRLKNNVLEREKIN